MRRIQFNAASEIDAGGTAELIARVDVSASDSPAREPGSDMKPGSSGAPDAGLQPPSRGTDQVWHRGRTVAFTSGRCGWNSRDSEGVTRS